MSTKMNFKFSTTFTRSSISSIKVSYHISKLHTTHSLPSPLNSFNIFNTILTLSLCHKGKWKTVIIHTKIVSNETVNIFRLSKLKISNTFFIAISSIIILSTGDFMHFVISHNNNSLKLITKIHFTTYLSSGCRLSNSHL